MSKKTIISATDNTIRKLNVFAKKNKRAKGNLVVTTQKLNFKAKRLAIKDKGDDLYKNKKTVISTNDNIILKLKVLAKKKESVRGKLVVTAKQLAATAKEKESIRRKLEMTAEKLAVTAKEKESVRKKLAVTAGELKLKATQLANLAKEKESIRSRLEITAKKLASTAKEKESVRKKLAVFAQEKENVRRKLVVTAEKLVVVATEKESVRKKLVVVAKQLAILAKEKEDIRKNLVATAKEKESIRRKLKVTAEKLAVTAKEKEGVRRRLAVVAKQLAIIAKEKERTRRRLVVTAKDLEQIRAKNEAMLESIGDGLVATDKNGRILLVNKAFERILGWREWEVQGKLMSTIVPMVDESGKEIPVSERFITKTTAIAATEEGKNNLLLNPKKISEVYYYVCKDKTRFPVAVTVAPVRLNNKIIGAIEIFRDITKEKEIDKAKSEFISLASHQLKTPPTAIKLLTERLLEGKMGKFTQKQEEYISDIHSSNERMIDLINALLNVSRIELGAFSIQVQENDACAIVKSILNEVKSVIDRKQLKLETTYEEKKIILPLDEPLFRIIINNIVVNAIHYTPEGGEIQVLCKTINKGQKFGKKILSENSFVVVISDTGYGIPEEAHDKLFTKFFRADNVRTKLPDGTGLGLYIVKSILDRSGGFIWFTSRENEGSVFYVAIPMTGMRMKDDKKEFID